MILFKKIDIDTHVEIACRRSDGIWFRRYRSLLNGRTTRWKRLRKEPDVVPFRSTGLRARLPKSEVSS